MEKCIDSIGFDKDGRFDLEGFTNSVFSRIRGLAVVIADDNSETSENDKWALIQVLKQEVLEVERYLKKWINES